jgi:hypothetical protein
MAFLATVATIVVLMGALMRFNMASRLGSHRTITMLVHGPR